MTGSAAFRRFGAAVFAVVVVLSLVPRAGAHTANVLVVGDSFTASPNQMANQQWSNSLSSVDGADLANNPRTAGCMQSTSNWPRQMERRTGVPVSDYSCTALTSAGAIERVTVARDTGALNPSTRAVVFAVGGNNFGPYGLAGGYEPLNQPRMNDRFAAEISRAAAIVRSVAPNARMVVAGLPEVTNGHGVCVANVVPGMPVGVPVPGRFAEDAIRQMQRVGAQRNGMAFVDNVALTRGHNTCTPNDKARYVSGIIDTTSPHHEMMLHPTVAGHAALAANNAAALGI